MKTEIKTNYDPNHDKKIKGDPKKTVFVGRLNYKTDEQELGRVFGAYGEIKRLRIVRDINTDYSKGYAFIEYQEKRSAEIAYNRGHRRIIDDSTVIVDREMCRIDSHWVPRRLGGGKGGESRRNVKEEQYIREIKRELRDNKIKQEVAASEGGGADDKTQQPKR